MGSPSQRYFQPCICLNSDNTGHRVKARKPHYVQLHSALAQPVLLVFNPPAGAGLCCQSSGSLPSWVLVLAKGREVATVSWHQWSGLPLHSWSVRVQAPSASDLFLFVIAATSVMFSFSKGSGDGQTGCIRSCNSHCSPGNYFNWHLWYTACWKGVCVVAQVLGEGGMEFTRFFLKKKTKTKPTCMAEAG